MTSFQSHRACVAQGACSAKEFQSVPPNSASQCHLTVAKWSVPPNSAIYQCHISVSCISAAFQCPSVMTVNAHHCNLPVPPHQCFQCHLSVSISAAYQCPSLQPH
ncbi:unnamed protein product [Staurois parvus]|uniref:Uncharacterized protein n=1 Tax=Staurois parvus TaxID=386267 RepID=A0ABN9C8F8_9NEOB|nr:unnamed protein product [Staurois parvus]